MVFKEADFLMLEDGFQYFDTPNGCLSAHNLREIADELDRRNKYWQEELDAYFAAE